MFDNVSQELGKQDSARFIGTLKKRSMNNTESEYSNILACRLKADDILWYAYEPITLKLANDCRYTPDFVVMAKDGTLECHEVKGFWRDDAKVKLKVASELFPFKFVLAVKKNKRWFVTPIS